MKEKNLLKDFQKKIEDTGSTAVQIINLTARINSINEHLKINKNDKAGQRGLMVLVGRRSRLSKYLKRERIEEHSRVISALGLRK